jgi:urate oxidase
VEEAFWERAVVDDLPHDHGFTKSAPERACATVDMAQGQLDPSVVPRTPHSHLENDPVGFANYHHDSFTLLPDCDKRCLSTKLSAEWACAVGFADFYAVRARIQTEIAKGLFGPADGGVFSVSLQATTYDCACLCLEAVPELQKSASQRPTCTTYRPRSC